MKTKNVKKGLLGLLCYVSVACSGQPIQPQEKLNPEQLKEDFLLFRSALEEAHPGMYAYTPKPVFDAAFDSTYATLHKPLSKQEFYKTLTPLVTMIRCGHVKFLPGDTIHDKYPYHTDELLPLKLFITDGKAYVERNYGEASAIPAGAEIIALNGKPMADILHKLLPYVTFADGSALSSKYLELSHYFSGYYAAFIEASPTYKVTYHLPDSSPQTIDLSAVTLETISQAEDGIAAAGEKEPPLQLHFQQSEVAVLTIKSFWFEDKETNFERFVENAFTQINAHHTKSLVIDLRNNEGGKDAYGALLYSYLTDQPFRYYDYISINTDKKFSFSKYAQLPWYFWLYRQLISRTDSGTYVWKRHENLKLQQPQPNPYLGDVYILVNGWSFSVTTEFSAVAYDHQRATFIGQETGGGYYGNNSGFFAIVHLPNSQFVLGIPLWRYHIAVSNYPYPDRGIIPQYPVVPSIHDKLQGVDREMKVAMEVIHQQTAILPESGR